MGSKDPLVVFLYILARDHLPTGTIEDIMENFVEPIPEDECIFSSPQVEDLAKVWAEKLRATDG